MIPLYDIGPELIDILELIHFIHDSIEPLRPILLVKEDSKQQCFFSILVLNKPQFKPIEIWEVVFFLRPVESF